MNKLPYFKSDKNKDGVNYPPKVTVDGKVVTVCLKRIKQRQSLYEQEMHFCKYLHSRKYHQWREQTEQMGHWA